MAGFLHRMVQRGLGRTRSVQPLYTARYARDGAPAALPATQDFRSAKASPTIRRQAAGDDGEERDDLSRSPAGDNEERQEEDGAGDIARTAAPDASQQDEENGTLMQQKPLSAVQRRASETRLHRQADQVSDEESDQAASAGDGGGDPGGSDAGLAGEAATPRSEVPEDEDLAPGRDNDTLLPKLQRREISSQTSAPRIFRQEEGEEEAAPPSTEEAQEEDDGTVQTSRESHSIARRAAPAVPVAPTPSPAQAPSRNQSRDSARKAPAAGPGELIESAEMLMPPASPDSGDRFSGELSDAAGDRAAREDSGLEVAGPESALMPGVHGDRRPDFSRRIPPASQNAAAHARSRSGEEPSAGPEIQISIGRIDIRAVGDAPETATQIVYQNDAAAPGQMRSLEEYLKSRNGEVQ